MHWEDNRHGSGDDRKRAHRCSEPHRTVGILGTMKRGKNKSLLDELQALQDLALLPRPVAEDQGGVVHDVTAKNNLI